MARPKKDPNIRQSEFLVAAKHLFFSKGYDSTSIQDILQAVGENSVSPSVFYHYFSSKEDIYHSVMENYIEEYIKKLETVLHDESLSIEARLTAMMAMFIETLLESKSAINTHGSMSNRLFALDLRERIASRIAVMWEEAIKNLPWLKNSGVQTKSLALYITGGICEMVYEFVFKQNANQQNIKEFADEIISFTANSLGVPKLIRRSFIARNKNKL
jgi:AcrR family transcriptional regulator